MNKNWMNRWRTLAAAAGLAGLLGGCDSASTIPAPPAVVNRVLAALLLRPVRVRRPRERTSKTPP